MLLKKAFFYSAILGCCIPSAIALPLKSDEQVMFIPDIAYETTSNKVATSIQVWIYQKERRLGMTTAFTKYLGIDKSQLSNEQYARLYARTQLFRVDSKRNKNIKIQFTDNSIYNLSATNKGGRSHTTIQLPKSVVMANNTINYHLYQAGKPVSTVTGQTIFVPKTGISVISDIDDTIKLSHVTDKKQLLINTAINASEPIEGMSDWYNKLATTGQNVTFHYISSSPIQLYPVLKEFITKANFPHGSFHLRESTAWNTLISGNTTSLNHKISNIEKLLTTFPQRQFILVGDSGQADPEIYADIMRRYPKQILYIAIRDVTNENSQATRYQHTFKDLDNSNWGIFKENPPNLDALLH